MFSGTRNLIATVPKLKTSITGKYELLLSRRVLEESVFLANLVWRCNGCDDAIELSHTIPLLLVTFYILDGICIVFTDPWDNLDIHSACVPTDNFLWILWIPGYEHHWNLQLHTEHHTWDFVVWRWLNKTIRRLPSTIDHRVESDTRKKNVQD